MTQRCLAMPDSEMSGGNTSGGGFSADTPRSQRPERCYENVGSDTGSDSDIRDRNHSSRTDQAQNVGGAGGCGASLLRKHRRDGSRPAATALRTSPLQTVP